MPFPYDEDDKPEIPANRTKPPSLVLWMFLGIPLGFLVMAFIGWLWILPDLRKNTQALNTNVCLSNLHELVRGMSLYAADNDDTLPNKNWNQTIFPYLKNVKDEELLFACPVQRRIDPESSGYALNQLYAGSKLHAMGPLGQDVLIFDSSITSPNAIAPQSTMPWPGRHEHGNKNNLIYADGSARTVDAIKPPGG